MITEEIELQYLFGTWGDVVGVPEVRHAPTERPQGAHDDLADEVALARPWPRGSRRRRRHPRRGPPRRLEAQPVEPDVLRVVFAEQGSAPAALGVLRSGALVLKVVEYCPDVLADVVLVTSADCHGGVIQLRGGEGKR